MIDNGVSSHFIYSVPLPIMKASENTLKWIMRFYPPLFFQRIWVKRFHPDFKGVDVKVSSSLLNRNYNSSIFGGTIFAAADPFYPILFDQIFKKKGYRTQVWLKSGRINYLKPARSTLSFTITLSDEDIEKAEEALKNQGKYVSIFHLVLYNESQEVCAQVESEVYLRNLNFSAKKP